jgi:hypothetical protein
MKSKLVSLFKYSLGVLAVFSACNASAEYYIAEASGCGCDGFGPPPPEYSYHHHYYHHHYHHYYHHYVSHRRPSSLSYKVYYVWQTAPACNSGCGLSCGSSGCGGSDYSSYSGGCGSANCDPIDWGPKSNMHGQSYDWDTRTRDDVY